ncbi:putative membrane protein [Nocardioides scoriae]|uniref:Putative membrane protein n=1 Tax=Nocardioides scoriae TaxID=642780 RepID=A0A1H1W4R3_9ACTN|nr:PH domain-containing protein [Nocardioides scoriae]SDS91496.1 putative membrane protein [Nocardioides scoriae]
MTEPGPGSPFEGPPAGPPPVPEQPWRRLDTKMLLVHPVQQVLRFLPVLVGLVVVGGSRGTWWQVAGVVVPILLGVATYFSTRFRITPDQLELRRGLVQRTTLSARLDRVRSVEVTAPVIHRLLGLTQVRISTGSASVTGDDGFALDGLAASEARELRALLLHRSEAVPDAPTGPLPVPSPTGDPAASPVPPVVEPDEVLLRFDPRWARFAPLTASGAVIASAVVAIGSQGIDALGIDPVSDLGLDERLGDVRVLPLVGVGLLVFLVLTAVSGVLGYLVTNWGFTLTRDRQGRSLQVRRGLTTTSETSVEIARVRGARLTEPIGLRLTGAAGTEALLAGGSVLSGGTATVAPAAPREVALATAARVLGHRGLESPLRPHGPAARRRRLLRAVVGAAAPTAALVVAAALDRLPWWPAVTAAVVLLPLGVALGADRYRRLGHALVEDHLVVRWGTVSGRHVALHTGGIIGWNLQQTWFQRRAGLATLVATTAAGGQSLEVVDVPADLAVALADAATPGLLTPFLAA